MNYQDNAAGVSSITGLDDYVITGTLDQYGPMNGVLVNGQSYAYYAKYANVEDGTDYETGQGVWSGGNTLSRDNITTSSNAGNSVNWGSGQKAIFIVADAELSTDMEQMVEGATKKILTVAERSNIATMKSKVDLITITQAANIDTMQAQINAAVAGMRYRGNWDASSGVFPGGGTALLGDFYYCSVSGTVDGNEFTAGDNIVALVNNASISTYAGNWSKHDQTDAVQSVAGLVGTITETQLRAALNVPDPFWYKSPGEPLLVLAIGDSNMVGIGDSSGTLTLNSNVYVRSTPGTSAWSAADLAWFNNSTVDPAGSTFPNPASAPTSFTGVLRNNNGDTGYAAATRLQQATGRDVYLFQTACGGKTMAYWLPGGGAGKEGMNALTAQLPAVFATSGLPEFFDVVIMSDSTNDAGTSVTPATFVSNFTTVYDHMVSEGWINPNYTKWFQLEAPQVYPSYAGWLGLQLLSQTFGERVSIISSVDLATIGDNTHFTGLSCQQLGYRSADAALGNLVTKPLIRAGAYIETVAGLTQDLDCNAFDLLDVDKIHANTTLGTPLTIRIDGVTTRDLQYYSEGGLLANTVTTLAMGGTNGAWIQSRMSAGAGFPAIRLVALNTLTGSSSVLAAGDAANGDLMTLSRTGLLHTEGGYSTDGAFNTTVGTFVSSVANGGSAVAFDLNTGVAYTTTAKLLRLRNNGTEVVSFGQAGDATLAGGLIAADAITHTGAFSTDFLGNVTAISPFTALDDISSANGIFLSSVASANNANAFVLNATNDMSGNTNTAIIDFRSANVSKLRVLTNGLVQLLNGAALSGTLSGTGVIATSGTIGTSDNMTCANLIAGVNVEGQFLHATGNLSADNLTGSGERQVVADASGVLQVAGWNWITATSTAQTTDAATTQTLITGSPADGAREAWELLVTGNRQSTAGTVFGRYQFTVTRVGATCTVSSTSTILKVTTGTGNTTTIGVAAFGTGFFATVNGNASETWDWKAQFRRRSII